MRLLSAALVVRAAASAVGAMHLAGWTHLDVKLRNVLLQTAGDGPFPLPEDIRLADLGMAEQLQGDGWVRAGNVGGTPEQAAPEQHWWRGCGEEIPANPPFRVGAAADVWGVGGLLAGLAGGGGCFGEPPTTQWQAIRQGLMGWCVGVARGPQLFSLLEDVVQCCMRPHPLDRCSIDFVVQQLTTVVEIARAEWGDACALFAPLLLE